MRRVFVFSVGAVVWAVVGWGGTLEFRSTWSAAPVKVDGTGDGWSANFVPIGDPPILVSVENDARYLYLCVRTSDPKVKSQIAFGGLTVWAEVPKASSGGMGVRFPMRARRRGGDRSRESGQGEAPKAPPVNAINDVSTEFELLGPTRDDALVVQRGPEEPVQVAIGDDSGVLVYEVRMPLKPSDDYPIAIGSPAGAAVALTLDTAPPKRQARPEGEEGTPEGESPRRGGGEGRGGYGPGGGMGGARGGRGGGHWGGGGFRGEGSNPFKVNIAVVLASAPETAKPAS